MEYLVSFWSPTFTTQAWTAVSWDGELCWCRDKIIEPPELARLAHLAPELFSVHLQCHEGRIFVDAARVQAEYPCLPGHLAIMALFKSHARTLFVDPALTPAPTPAPGSTDAASQQVLQLSPDLAIGSLFLSPEWGTLDPVAHPYMPAQLCGSMHLYGRTLPVLPVGGLTLVLIPELSLLQWQQRYPAAQLLRHGMEPTAQLHIMTLEELRRAECQLRQAVPAKAHPAAVVQLAPRDVLRLCTADDLVRWPLLQCWNQAWHALWLDHCPIQALGSVSHMVRSCTVVLERRQRSMPKLFVLQQQAVALGLPLWQVFSPWLLLELQRTAHVHAELPPLHTPRHHWCHLSREWHCAYAEQGSILGKIAVGLGIEKPQLLRIATPSACQQHWQSCTKKRKRPSTVSAAFMEEQLTQLGRQSCGVCMERPTDTLLKCGHTLCLGCVRECLRRQGKCPHCRHVLATPSSAYFIAKTPLTAQLVRAVHGGKVSALWELLQPWRKAAVVLVAQLGPTAQRRLAGILRQLELPCALLHGSDKTEQLRRFHAGQTRRLLVSPSQMAGLILPHVNYAVYLHTLLDTSDQMLERAVQWALPATAELHRLCLRNTVEQLLLPLSSH